MQLKRQVVLLLVPQQPVLVRVLLLERPLWVLVPAWAQACK